MAVLHKICAYIKCGKPFTTENNRTIYCSKECAHRASSYAQCRRKGFLPKGTPRPFVCDLCKKPGTATTATTRYHPECFAIIRAEQNRNRRRSLADHPIMATRSFVPLPVSAVKDLLNMGCLSTLTVTQLERAGYANVPAVMRKFPDHIYPGRGPIGWKSERVAA